MIASIALMFLSAAAATTPCESLVSLKLDKATISSAQMVPEGPAPARGGARGPAVTGGARGAANAPAPAPGPPPAAARIPAHCRVEIVLKPSADSLIRPAGPW